MPWKTVSPQEASVVAIKEILEAEESEAVHVCTNCPSSRTLVGMVTGDGDLKRRKKVQNSNWGKVKLTREHALLGYKLSTSRVKSSPSLPARKDG